MRLTTVINAALKRVIKAGKNAILLTKSKIAQVDSNAEL